MNNKCYCKLPCWRYIEGHCDGTRYEYYHHCEQLLEYGKEQRNKNKKWKIFKY